MREPRGLATGEAKTWQPNGFLRDLFVSQCVILHGNVARGCSDTRLSRYGHCMSRIEA